MASVTGTEPANTGLSEDDWTDLLDGIETGQIIPVLGEGAASCGDADEALYPKLAADLASRLGVSTAGGEISLSAVARAYLVQPGHVRNQIYTRLHRLATVPRPPGSIVRHLAAIEGFNVYLSATCDSLLDMALRTTAPKPRPPNVVAYHPNADIKDLPDAITRIKNPIVYHLLGKASPSRGEFVVWEDDLLDFVLGLARDFQTDSMRYVRDALSTRSLLAIGLELSDWILLLLLRMARQHPFLEEVDRHRAWINEPVALTRRSTVFMIGGLRGGVRPIDNTVKDFVGELYRRWQARMNSTQQSGDSGNALQRARGGDPYVFISYAREDETAARKIKVALEERCKVFLDVEGLRPGVNFERELQEKVWGAAVFVSIVSRNTEMPGAEFFKREQNWAAQRAEWLSDAERGRFYLPVIVDDALPTGPLRFQPDIFRSSQWVHCPGGSVELAPQFVPTVARICEEARGPR